MKIKFWILYHCLIILVVLISVYTYLNHKNEIYGIICSADLIAIATGNISFIFSLSILCMCYYIMIPYMRGTVIVTYRKRSTFVYNIYLKCFKYIFFLGTTFFLICGTICLIVAPAKNCNWNYSNSFMQVKCGNFTGYNYSLLEVYSIYYVALLLLGLSVGAVYIFFSLVINKVIALASFLILYFLDRVLRKVFLLVIARTTIYTHDLFMIGFEWGRWLFNILWIVTFIVMTSVIFRKKNIFF